MKKNHDVWFNRGRWLVRCPICGSANQIRPTGNQKKIKYFCGSQYCYPGKLKRTPQISPDGKITYKYSYKEQRAAANAANQNGEIFVAVLPEDWKIAEDLLRVRRTIHQAFYPGNFDPPNNKNETIADLKRENASDPELDYLDRKGDKKSPAAKPGKTEKNKNIKPLTDAEFRRLQ